MARYINLDEAIKHLQGDCKAKYPLSYCNGISAAIREIGKFPTADVVPSERLENAMKLLDKTEDELCEARGEIEKLTTELKAMREILKTLNAYSEHIARDIPIVADVAAGKV